MIRIRSSSFGCALVLLASCRDEKAAVRAPTATPVVVGPAGSSPSSASARMPEDAPPPARSFAAKLGDSSSSCSAKMFSDHVAGTRGLWSFEDKVLGLIGFRDARGVTVIPPQFRFAYEYSATGITAAVDASGKPVFIDVHGRVIATAYVFDNGPDYFVSGVARIIDASSGKTGFIDEQGRITIAPRWDHAGSFCNRRAPVCNGCTRGKGDEADVWSGGQWGYIDESGQVVIPVDLDQAEMFNDGTALVRRRGGKHERIDINGHPAQSR